MSNTASFDLCNYNRQVTVGVMFSLCKLSRIDLRSHEIILASLPDRELNDSRRGGTRTKSLGRMHVAVMVVADIEIVEVLLPVVEAHVEYAVIDVLHVELLSELGSPQVALVTPVSFPFSYTPRISNFN